MEIINPDRARGVQCKRRLYLFYQDFWETIETPKLILNWHIEYICDQLQEAYHTWAKGDQQDDIIINVPPGSSKSTIVTQIFPAWLWANDPRIRVISSSYSSSLSVAHAVKTRDILKSEKFERYYPGLIRFKSDSDGKEYYKNTKKGDRFTTSTNGTVTGVHADFIINDDPLNPKQAAGEKELENAAEFSKTTLSSRKTDKARTVTILVMQRLHDLDPTGQALKSGKKYRHICLPGLLKDGIKPKPAILAEKYLDGLLDVRRLSSDILADMLLDLGSYGFANQVQQVSAPQAGGIWKRWFIPIPDELMPYPHEMTGHGTDWDTAYTENERNAASAYITSGMYEGKMFIDRAGFFFKEFPEAIKAMKEQAAPHYIEAKATGKSAKQTLTRAGIPAIEINVPGGADKIARANSATPFAEGGLICVRKSILDMIYNDEQVGILRFPNAPKKDLADALAQAIIRLLGNVRISRPRTVYGDED